MANLLKCIENGVSMNLKGELLVAIYSSMCNCAVSCHNFFYCFGFWMGQAFHKSLQWKGTVSDLARQHLSKFQQHCVTSLTWVNSFSLFLKPKAGATFFYFCYELQPKTQAIICSQAELIETLLSLISLTSSKTWLARPFLKTNCIFCYLNFISLIYNMLLTFNLILFLSSYLSEINVISLQSF